MKPQFLRSVSLRLAALAGLVVTAHATCTCYFGTSSEVNVGTGFLAQTDIYDGGCTGWTMARYSSATEITATRSITGRLCSNGQTDVILAEEQIQDDYILAEWYWNLYTEDVHDKGRSKVIKDGDEQAQAFIDP